jgi:SAM-dependent methyltransferase
MNEIQARKSTAGGLDLFLISFLLLFFEMVQIRWISSNIRVVSYFANVILISCFLGFGVGCIMRKRRGLFPLFPLIVLALSLLCWYVAGEGILNPATVSAYFFGGGGRFSWLAMVPFVFAVNTFCFLCLGQKLAQEMDRFPPLRGYSWNLLGSLAGTLAFSLFSFLALPPLTWFALTAVLAAWLMRRQRLVAKLGLLAFVPVLLVVAGQQQRSIWSMYNKIFTSPPDRAGSFRLVANQDYHQLALNLTDRWVGLSRNLAGWRRTYDFPYLLTTARERVLVLGSGMGNDVATALRNGCERVDAVELDPVILAIGRQRHPERPYADPRVRTYVADARRFVASSRERYDIVVMGWLDSHRLFSALSSVRQDNFVYTVDSLRAIRRLLKPDGLLVMSFYVGKSWIGDKLYQMTRQAFGYPPRVFAYVPGGYRISGQTFVVGAESGWRMPAEVPGFSELTSRYAGSPPVAVPTDDWPFLYYRDRSLSPEYLKILAIFLAFSVLLVLYAAPLGKVSRPDRPLLFFLLGAGFLLMEVRNIIALALVFGSTWVVTSVVVAAALVMVFLANLLVERGRLRSLRLAWPALGGSLLLSLAWSLGPGRASASLAIGLVTTVIVSLTFLFAGAVFSLSFADVATPSIALGFNVLGSVVGGLAEYLSLLTGVRGLLVIAMGLYLLAFLARGREARG